MLPHLYALNFFSKVFYGLFFSRPVCFLTRDSAANKLSGTMPTEIFGMTNLEYLVLSVNRFTG